MDDPLIMQAHQAAKHLLSERPGFGLRERPTRDAAVQTLAFEQLEDQRGLWVYHHVKTPN